MRRRIRDKMRQASSKTKKKGGRPSKNPQAYESELPKMSDGNKDWLKYPSSAKTELSEVDVDGSTPKYREAIGCDGSRIRSVTPPSQEDALDEQRYGPIIDGIEDGTTYVEARRTARNALEIRWTNPPPPEPEDLSSEDIEGYWEGLTWHPGRKKSM